MAEPWSGSRFPPYIKRSKTVLGEIGDVTKRKNSLEVNKLGEKLRLMGREMQAVNNEIRHQQSVLEVKSSSSVSARRLSASASNTRDLLIRHEQDNMQAISQKCKDFIHSGISGQEVVVSRINLECPQLEEGGVTVPSPTHQSYSSQSSENSLTTSIGSSATDQEKASFTGLGSGDSEPPFDVEPLAKLPRERRVGVVHNMDVHLEFDSSEQDSNGYFPGRKEPRTRRVSKSNVKWECLSQPKHPVRSNREIEVAHHEEMKKLANEDNDRNRARGRRRSLPVILGRTMTRHDRKKSKSRDNLLLPEVGRNRSVSPDVRFRVKYAVNEEDDGTSPIPGVPFTQKATPRHIQVVNNRGASISPRPSVPKLEIDLSLPVTPRPSPRLAKSDQGNIV